MAHERHPSALDGRKEPHAVSLKVLRLSRPSLATQYPLPRATSAHIPAIPAVAALSYPSADENDGSILSPLLTLPPAFGSAYVGETFACTICANNNNNNNNNNEVAPADDAPTISGVSIGAEMQTPSTTVALELNPPAAEDETQERVLGPGRTLQKIVRFDLKEPGNHVLAITVTYTETAAVERGREHSPERASAARVRTFRKLYQFLAQQSLAVRTKTVEMAAEGGSSNGKARPSKYLLEAQLENVSEDLMTLETIDLVARSPLKSTSLNWDVQRPDLEEVQPPTLNPREVLQVAFLIERGEGSEEGDAGVEEPVHAGGRMTLGQLSLAWRTAMGERGMLSTGWLTFRKR